MTRTEQTPAAAPRHAAPRDTAPRDQDRPSEPQRVRTLAEAEQLLLDLVDVMDALLAIVEQETQLVRAGRCDAAAQLQATKSDLARGYVAWIATLRASADYLTRALPNEVAALRLRHDAFRALLQINLTVLAVENAVADGARPRQSSAPPARTVMPARDGTARRRLPYARTSPGSLPPPPSRPSIPDGVSSTRRRWP